MSEDLTHYDVLGVEPSTDKDAIKSAYQERLNEVQADAQREQATKKPDQGSIDGYRREEASIRNAWQVLSDPYQRGRYDATIEMGGGGAADALDTDADDDAPVARAPGRGGRERRPPPERPPGLFSTEPLPTPASWPPGLRPPPPRARVLALTIDMFVLMVLFIALSVARTVALDEIYPKESKQLDQVAKQLDRLDVRQQNAQDRVDSAQDRLDAARENGNEAKAADARQDRNTAQDAVDRLEKQIERADKRYDNLQSDVQPVLLGGYLFILGVMLLYLVPSSVISGRTLGKKLMQIRAVNADGSRLRLRGAMLRYGLPLIVVLMLQQLGPIAFGLVLFAILSWPRNPNLQGMHDRMARTIVVDG
ncbi:MAG: RDD family protein [Acidimicrobiia bacterium]